MFYDSVTNKGRQMTRAVIVSGILFSPFSRPSTLTLLFFRVPQKKKRMPDCRLKYTVRSNLFHLNKC